MAVPWLPMNIYSIYLSVGKICMFVKTSTCSGATLALGLVGLSLAIRAGETALWDQWAVQGIYCAFAPLALFVCDMLGGFWVESLPSQVRLLYRSKTPGLGVSFSVAVKYIPTNCRRWG